MKLARDGNCLLFKGKSFHSYGPIIFSDFLLLLVRAKEIVMKLSEYNGSGTDIISLNL